MLLPKEPIYKHFSRCLPQGFWIKLFVLIFFLISVIASTAWSFNQAQPWSAPLNISQTSTESINPTLATDATGTLHVVWTETLNLEGRTEYSLVYSSMAQGLWSDPIDIVFTSGEVSNEPSLGIDGQDVLHLVWQAGFQDRLYYSQVQAIDAGSARNWSKPALVSPIVALSGAPDLQIGEDGTLHVLYPVLAGDLSGIYYLSSHDHGRTWSSANYVYLNGNPGRMVTNSALAVDNQGGLHAVWVETNYPETFPPLGIRYAHSFDGGQTWTSPRNIDGPYDSPGILALGDSQIHIVWSGTNPERHKFHFFSTDRGNTWSPPVITIETGGFQGKPGLASDSQNTLHLVQVSNAPGTPLEALFYQSFQNKTWYPPQKLVERVPNSPWHPLDPDIAVGLGNQLHVVVQASMQNRSGDWAHEILYFNAVSNAPPVLPQAPIQAAPTSVEEQELEALQPEIAVISTSQSNTQSSSATVEPSIRGSNPLYFAIISVVVLLIVVFVLRQSRRKD